MSHDVGDAVRVTYEVRDDELVLVNPATVVLTVTLPNLTTQTPPIVNPPAVTGEFEHVFLLAAPGRHIFAWVTTDPNTAGAQELTAVTPSNLPTLAEVKTYLDSSAGSWTDPELLSALAAETASQAQACRVGAVYPADLAEALKRRVACNLARRSLPLAVLQGDAEGGSLTLPGRDPEVRRLEGPYRKLVFA